MTRMPFLQEARDRVAANDMPADLTVVVRYLLENAIGKENAVPIPRVLQALETAGYPMEYNKFQTSLLNDTREGSIFIGSCSKGLFLIETQEDARTMRDFYRNLMQAQQAKMERVQRLARESGWELD